MVSLRGYSIVDELHSGAKMVVYRGVRDLDGRRVILKASRSAESGSAALWREFEVLEFLKASGVEGVIRALSVEEFPGGAVLVLEDFGQEPLDRTLDRGGMPLSRFLIVAADLTRTVGELHRCGVIHKNIKPSNIYHDPISRRIALGDFGLAARLARDSGVLQGSLLLEGSLPYMSPEQTGRMNRAIDYRSDYYSLGVSFYEMLTGRLPFESDDPMELVHSHIAREPVPPHEVNPAIPSGISRLILKLLAKTAEHRYQSARGLLADLDRCGREPSGDAPDLGLEDVAETFHLPQKLYGRESQVADLLDSFQRVSLGGTELVWVAGGAGMGKSALVGEIQKPIAGSRGHFISGKFDQFQHEIAYSALIRAFADLVRQLLTERAPVLEAWKLRLQGALHPNGRVITELVPEIELILGRQPPMPELGLTEAEARFTLVFREFVRACADPEHPLVLFLDDLQWADSATLRMLKLLVTAPGMKNLLIVGAYRDDETPADSPLQALIDELREGPVPCRRIQLPPLGLAEVNGMVSQTLRMDPPATLPLSQLIFAKTQGNPFFVSEFFRSLYLEKLVDFDPAAGGWNWNLERIRRLEITDNVVELMAGRIQRLPSNTQAALELAACAGNQFELKTLCEVAGRSPAAVVEDLRPALDEGLILPLDEGYRQAQELGGAEAAASLPEVRMKFSHDRVHQAAYERLVAPQQQALHRRIGQRILGRSNPDQERERIFEIVNHLNLGVTAMDDAPERREVARLNWLAGCKARTASAYGPARSHFETGLRLLDAGKWETDYELTRALHQELMQTGFLLADDALMDACGKELYARGRTVLDRIPALETRILAKSRQMDYTAAVETGLEALRELGAPLPAHPGNLHILGDLIATRSALSGRTPQQLLELPVLTDPQLLATMRILMSVSSAAYFASPNLFPIIVFRLVRLSIREGNAAISAFAYVCYGLILCGVLGDFDRGHQFGELALRVLERFKAQELKAKVYFLYNVFVRHWREEIRASLEPFLEGAKSGLETGDVEFHSYSLYFHGCFSLFQGEPLEPLARRLEQQHASVARLKADKTDLLFGWLRQVVAELASPPSAGSAPAFDEPRAVEAWKRARDHTALGYYHSFRTLLLYFRGDPAGAVREVEAIRPYLQSVMGQYFIPLYRFYQSLSLLALLPGTPPLGRWRIHLRVARNQRDFRRWARFAPGNHRHRYELVEAERARVSGRSLKAMDWYSRSIRSAREARLVHEEALAYELAGSFHHGSRREDLGLSLLARARTLYASWGARSQVARLDRSFPGLSLESGNREDRAGSPATPIRVDDTSLATHSAVLDLASVLKTSQALSGEIVISRLMGKLVELMVENAGAQRGLLILKRDHQLVVEAEGTTHGISVVDGVPLESFTAIPQSLVNYVARTREPVVLGDATREGLFVHDPYIVQAGVKSVLCLPVVHQGKLAGLAYMENNLVPNAFTAHRLEILQMLSAQAAISLENAGLYHSLEQKVTERTKDLQLERDKSEQLLLNVLPRPIAEELKAHGRVKPRFYESATILFADMKDFTQSAGAMSPGTLVGELNRIFLYFDQVCDRRRIEKLKTIGDAYMCVGGLPEVSATHPVDACLAALEFQGFMKRMAETRAREGKTFWEMRIGIHTGPVMAGVIGKNKFAFDVWGDAVNVAARLESSGEAGRISISEATYQIVAPLFETVSRGEIHLKHRGMMLTHFLQRLRPEYSADEAGERPNSKFQEAVARLSLPQPAGDPPTATGF
ncbi:MAG: AAA family ATPase [Verrucomicrobiales bacterium]|nr:AAA family ATPase [Verrucomicrobiales bacterium]